MMSETLRHVIASIGPVSEAHAEGARLKLAALGVPMVEQLGARLAAAQHTARIRARRTLAVVICDHATGDPGIALGAAHPTLIASRAIADGSAALAHVARTANTPIVLVDAGAREPIPDAVELGRVHTRDLLREPAMTVVDAALALDAGIALALSLEVDLIAVGALGLGSEVSTAALRGALLRERIDGPEADASALGLAWDGSPLETLARFGGGDTCVLAGLMLAAASMNVPTILDGPATGAAALVAAAFAPEVRGYLIAAHAGSGWPRPIFEVGLGHGEGTGAAMALSLVDQCASMTA